MNKKSKKSKKNNEFRAGFKFGVIITALIILSIVGAVIHFGKY